MKFIQKIEFNFLPPAPEHQLFQISTDIKKGKRVVCVTVIHGCVSVLKKSLTHDEATSYFSN